MKESLEENRRKIGRNNEGKKGGQLIESKSESLQKVVLKNQEERENGEKKHGQKKSANVKKARKPELDSKYVNV